MFYFRFLSKTLWCRNLALPGQLLSLPSSLRMHEFGTAVSGVPKETNWQAGGEGIERDAAGSHIRYHIAASKKFCEKRILVPPKTLPLSER